MTFGSVRSTAAVNNALNIILRSSEGFGANSLDFMRTSGRSHLHASAGGSLAISKANQLAGDSASVRLEEKSVKNACGLVGGIVPDLCMDWNDEGVCLETVSLT